MSSLLVVVSFHGYGHIAQTAPVVNELACRCPALEVTVQCAAPRAVLAEHFKVPFAHLEEAADFGMLMASSLDVRVEESHERYRAFHADWERHVAAYADRLADRRPDLVLANIAYLPLAAARRAGMPAVALCSLNWADIYHSYCCDLGGAARIYEQMMDAYRSADRFLVPAPGMDVPRLDNVRRIGPIARRGRDRRAEIDALRGLSPHERLVLLFMGGVRTDLAIRDWPRLDGVKLLIGGTGEVQRPEVFALDALGMPYIDIVASCDALITKPGYGGFAEAACNAVPVLYTRRDRWPEAEFLVRWLDAHGRCRELPRQALERGEILEPLRALWAQPKRPAVTPTGAAEAADLLAPFLPA